MCVELVYNTISDVNLSVVVHLIKKIYPLIVINWS